MPLLIRGEGKGAAFAEAARLLDAVGLGPDWVLGHPERDIPYLRNTNQESISWTRGLESSAEIHNLLPALEKAGFKESEIEKILGGNLLRLMKDVLPMG